MKPSPAGSSVEDRILTAADRLFYEHGIRLIGVDRVAAEARVSKRTLYKHYASKDVLVTAYLQRRAMQHAAPHSGNPLQDVLGLFDRLARAVSDSRFRGCPFVNAVVELGGGELHAAQSVSATFKHQRVQWLETQLRLLDAADPQSLAVQIAILVEGGIASSLVRGGDVSMIHAARRAACTLLSAAGVALPADQRGTASLSAQS
jgi:AcrR family transcriptional regulator